jgi:hypothetical protein
MRRNPNFKLACLLAVAAGVLAGCSPGAAQPAPVVGPAQAMAQPALDLSAGQPAESEAANEAAEAGLEAALPAEPPASCPVTAAPEPPFAPPAPWPAASPYAGQFWHGSAALWTMLNAHGVWRALPKDAHGFGQKLPWWRDGYFWKDEPQPALVVTGRRLDAEAPPLEALPASNGFHDDLGSFMMTGFNLPTAGCWEVTGAYGEARLSFVVWVAED